jgi:hypothetical protein
VIKRIVLTSALLLAAPSAKAADAIVHLDAPAQTLYARIFTSDAAAVAVALTEGTGNAVGRYVATDAALAATSLNGTTGVYAYKVFSGTPSTSADDPLFGVGSLDWKLTAAQSQAAAIRTAVGLASANLDTQLNSLEPATLQPASQSNVPPARTWVLVPNPTEGLIGDRKIALAVGDTKVFAVDFRNDLATNGLLTGVTSVTESGAGVTNDDDADGYDGTRAIIELTGVSAGTYTLEVVVTYDDSDGGGVSTGTVTVVVY